MSGRTPSSSSQHYHHQNQDPSASSSSANRSQQRLSSSARTGGAAAPNVTCSICGCLNFSNEATCDPCREKMAATSQSGGSSSSPSSATGSSSAAYTVTTGKTLPVVTQPVSPRTAILKKQTPVPQPRTGIVTGLRTGLPIDAYRSGGRRNSLLGAKISRDGESPASSQSLVRSNSSSSESELRAIGSSSANVGGSSSSAQPAARPSRGTELYQRVLDQQRQSREAKRKADANTGSSISNTTDVDVKSSIAEFFGAESGSATASSVTATPPPPARPVKRLRVTTRYRLEREDVIDLISSSDENEDNDDGGGDANLVGGDDSSSAEGDKTNGQKPQLQQPALTATTTTLVKPPAEAGPSAPAATSAPASRSEANASSAVQAQPPSEKAARIQNAAVTPSPASGAATQPAQNTLVQETVISYEEDYGEAPFRSRCFPSIQFDPTDFPPPDAAIQAKLRAQRNNTGGEVSVGSSQQSDVSEPVRRAVVAAPPVVAVPAPPAVAVPAPPVLAISARAAVATPAPRAATPASTTRAPPVVVPPVPQPQTKKPTESVAPKPAPASILVVARREEPPRPVQAPVSAPSITPAVATPYIPVTELVQPPDASAASSSASASIRSPRLKRTASGNCQEQAIELGDDDESFRQEQTFSTRGELFQSRIFQSIEFNARDFSTVHDGLHVARRTKISAQNEASGQQQPLVEGPPTQERSVTSVPPPSNSQARPPASSPPLPTSSIRATIPLTSDRVPATSSRPAAAETSRPNPQGQPVIPGRPVNVVPMSPKESPIWKAPSKAPTPSAVSPSVPPPQGLAGSQRAPVPQSAAPPVASTSTTTPVTSTSAATPVVSRPVSAPAASKPFTASPVVAKPSPAPAAFSQPAYSFGSRPTTATPVVSKPPASSVASTPVVTLAAPMTSAPPVAAIPVFSRPIVPTPVISRSTTATPVVSAPAATPTMASHPAVSKPVTTAPLTASKGLQSSSTNRSSEALRSTTTAPAVPEKPSTATTNSAAVTILLARKKLSQPTPPAVTSNNSAPTFVAKDVQSTTAVPVAATPTVNQQVPKVEVKKYHVAAKPPRVFKPPTLGACSADFMGFMKDFIDGDDDEVMNDEEETRKLHMQLLEVVDLTSLTDSDDDDDSSDGYEFSEPPTPRTAAAASLAPPLTGALSGNRPGFTLSLQPQQSTFSLNAPTGFFASGAVQTSHATAAGGAIMPPKIARPRAARQMEPCVICEEKRWVRSMIHCKECGKYYHKKCAKEYGDEKICWNCELDGMIDDSDLTETHHDEVVGMLSTLRPATSSSEEEDNDAEEEEEQDDEDMDGATANDAEPSRTNGEEEGKREADDEDDDGSGEDANAVALNRTKSQFPGATTKSMQRWKAFLDVSTSTVEKSFHEVTKAITEDLQSDERKTKYSKGFTTPEIFQAAISEVLDSYADLQDQLDREAREKSRSGPSATGGGNGSSGGDTQVTSGAAEAVVTTSESSNAVAPPPARVILDLSGQDHHSSVAQTPQLSRVGEIIDGA